LEVKHDIGKLASFVNSLEVEDYRGDCTDPYFIINTASSGSWGWERGLQALNLRVTKDHPDLGRMFQQSRCLYSSTDELLAALKDAILNQKRIAAFKNYSGDLIHWDFFPQDEEV